MRTKDILLLLLLPGAALAVGLVAGTAFAQSESLQPAEGRLKQIAHLSSDIEFNRRAYSIEWDVFTRVGEASAPPVVGKFDSSVDGSPHKFFCTTTLRFPGTMFTTSLIDKETHKRVARTSIPAPDLEVRFSTPTERNSECRLHVYPGFRTSDSVYLENGENVLRLSENEGLSVGLLSSNHLGVSLAGRFVNGRYVLDDVVRSHARDADTPAGLQIVYVTRESSTSSWRYPVGWPFSTAVFPVVVSEGSSTSSAPSP